MKKKVFPLRVKDVLVALALAVAATTVLLFLLQEFVPLCDKISLFHFCLFMILCENVLLF